MYGMRLSQLTPELVDEILDIYCFICDVPKHYSIWRRNQSGWTGAWHLKEIQEGLRHRNAVEWRYGSGLPGSHEDRGQYDKNAKFYIWLEKGYYEDGKHVDEIISFSFDPNIVQGERAQKMKEDFRKAVEGLLVRRGLAVELKRS